MVVHHTHAWSPGGQKWVSELLELELWSVVSHHGRAASVVNLDKSPQPTRSALKRYSSLIFLSGENCINFVSTHIVPRKCRT